MPEQDLPNLDLDITRLPQDIRADLAERGRNDLYFFGKAIMGYREMTPHCHMPLCVFHDSHPARLKLTIHPRGTYKTSVVTISKNTQKAVKNPNERILIVNEVADNAEGFMSSIRQNFEANRVLRALYSEVIPPDVRKTVWNDKAFRLKRDWRGPEETFEAMGILSTLTSHHYTHLAFDDVISEDAVKSPTVMADTINRLVKFPSLMVNPEVSTADFTGTRWALHDVYSHLTHVLGDELARYVRGAVFNGELLFPELLGAETLAKLRELYGPYMFSCLYMSSPRDVANQDFNVEDLRQWRWSSDEEGVVLYSNVKDEDGYPVQLREWPLDKLDITVSVDLAMAEKITDDRNAIVTVGTSPLGEAVVLDAWARRCTPIQVIEKLFDLKRRFAVRAFGIESVAYQKALKYFLQAECERRGEYMNIVDLKAIPSKRGTGSNSKEMRIRGLQPSVARSIRISTTHKSLRPSQDSPEILYPTRKTSRTPTT